MHYGSVLEYDPGAKAFRCITVALVYFVRITSPMLFVALGR